jgi:hypothetical protein
MLFNEYYLKESSGLFYHGSPYSFDKFDMNKIGTGDGLNKYGFGLYFADNEDLAAYYAAETFNTKKSQNSGLTIYTVRINGTENFYDWNDLISEDLYIKIADKLTEIGYESDADTMKEELQSYGETYSMEQTYGILRDIFKSDKQTTEFLYQLDVNGVTTDDIHGRGKIYVVFSDDLIKIIDKRNLGDDDNAEFS